VETDQTDGVHAIHVLLLDYLFWHILDINILKSTWQICNKQATSVSVKVGICWKLYRHFSKSLVQQKM